MLVLAIVLAAAPARAEQVGVVVSGDITLQPKLASSLEGWLRDHGHLLVSSPLDAAAISSLIDCFVLEDLSCARSVVEHRSKARAVVFARAEIAKSGDPKNVTLVAYWVQKGHLPMGERRNCSHCTPQQLASTADDLMAALAAEPPPPDHGIVPPAQPEVLDHADRPEPGRSSGLAPKLVIGGGVALIVTAGVLLAINAEPARTGVQMPTYTDYGPPAYALAATGAVAVGVGVYWWLHTRHHTAPVAAVAPTRSGAVLGWFGTF
jgi:hypothetical protein